MQQTHVSVFILEIFSELKNLFQLQQTTKTNRIRSGLRQNFTFNYYFSGAESTVRITPYINDIISPYYIFT